MRIDTLRLKGFLRFTDTVTLDFRDLPSGLIAVVGPNGAGKSTILEAPIAAIYRSFMSRDHELAAYATGRDSYLELDFGMEGAGNYTARVNVDGPKRNSSAVLKTTLPDGSTALLNDGKVSTFDKAVAERFPTKDVLLASAFAAQNKSGSFITLDKKGRKDLFSTLLGLEHYQAMSETARQAMAIVDRGRTYLDAITQELLRETSQAMANDLQLLRDQLAADTVTFSKKYADVTNEIGRVQQTLVECQVAVTAYATATARHDVLTRDLKTRQSELATAKSDKVAAELACDREHDRLVSDRDKQLQDVANRIANNEGLLSREHEILTAVEDMRSEEERLGQLQGQITEARNTLSQTEQALQHAKADLEKCTQADQALARVNSDVRLLKTVPCGGIPPYASCQFLKNAVAAQATIPDLESVANVRGTVSQRIADLQKDFALHAGDVLALNESITMARASIDTSKPVAQYADALAVAKARIAELVTQKQQIAESFDTQSAAAHERAATRTAELDRVIDSLVALIDGLSVQVAACQKDVELHGEAHTYAHAATQLLKDHQEQHAGLQRHIATLEAQSVENEKARRVFEEKRVRLNCVNEDSARLAAEYLDWQTLAKAFSREGLPVLEIDAAGPTISAFTNDLLAACFGSRFTVELITQREKADGKGYTDDFSIQVYDNERGGDPRDIADLSGGEQVIVAEALMNAIAIYVNTTSQMPIRTCWRDETTGALDPENATRYLSMLRKVQELGGFHHVFFITHNPEAAALADAQIQVADGTARIALPPFEAVV